MRYLLSACWLALALLAVSGGLMFAMAADRYVEDPFFLWKIATVAEGVAFLAFVQFAAGRWAERWDAAGAVPVTVQVMAGASIPLWLAAVTFGRFIYTIL
jgi:hypothetical protein